MSNFGSGFIEFGSGDDSIVLQSSLKSASSVTSPDVGPAGVIQNSAQISYDSGLGAKFGSNGAFNWTDLTNFIKANYQGQVSFEIQRSFLCQNSPDAAGAVGGSSGYVHDSAKSNTAMIVMYDSAGSNLFGNINIFRDATGAFQPKCGRAGGFTSAYGVHSAGKSDFIKVTFSWNGDVNRLYIDENLHSEASGALVSGRTFQRIWAGSDRAVTDRSVSNHYMRNLVVSTKPVNLPVIPALQKIVMLGDSYTNQAGTAIGSQLYDVTVNNQIKRAIHSMGLGVGEIINRSQSGATWNWDGTTKGGNTTTISYQLQNAIDDNGSIYVMYGGANDVTENAAVMSANVESNFKEYIADIINGADKAKGIVIINQTAIQGNSSLSGTDAQRKANVLALNAIYEKIPAYAETVKTGWGSKVFIYDAFTECGGWPMPTNFTKGGLDGDNDIHPSAFQAAIVGKGCGQTVAGNLLG